MPTTALMMKIICHAEWCRSPGTPVKYSLMFLSLLLLSSVMQAQTATGDTPGKQIMEILSGQTAAWNAGDIDGYMEGYWKSDSLLFTSGGRLQRGWDSTMRKYKAAYPTKQKMGILTFSAVEIHEISPEAAWIFGRWDLRRDGDPAGGVFTLVVRRFGDEWKIVHDHTSVNPPADRKNVE